MIREQLENTANGLIQLVHLVCRDSTLQRLTFGDFYTTGFFRPRFAGQFPGDSIFNNGSKGRKVKALNSAVVQQKTRTIR